MRLAPLLLVASAVAVARVDAQQVIVSDPGPGPVGRRLIAALAEPHNLIPPAPMPARLTRDSTYPRTVIVLGRDAVIEGHVRGDVIVVGGDAFMHPGALVEGRVMAIGGAVYESLLASIRAGIESHRDFTFDIEMRGATYVLSYRVVRLHPSPSFSLPGAYGARIPNYDRSDGLSLPFGPMIALDTGKYEFNPTITYRSNLGALDPAITGDLLFGRRSRAQLFVGRTTLTNDDWIWSDLINSAAVIFRGLDTRNYYRGSRASATVYHLYEAPTIEFEPFIGLRAERGRSVGPDSFATRGPWSILDRKSVKAMLRPNPRIVPGDIRSVIVGGRFGWEAQRVRAAIDLTNEGADFTVGSQRFVQSTLNAEVSFPTFGTQSFLWNAHIVYTFGDTAPPQRWSYLGGAGTIVTRPLLSLGGDRLFYFESNYVVPIQGLNIPVLGPPSLTLRHVIGSAGVETLSAFEQNLALRAVLSFMRVDIAVDPARRNWEFGVGLSAAR